MAGLTNTEKTALQVANAAAQTADGSFDLLSTVVRALGSARLLQSPETFAELEAELVTARSTVDRVRAVHVREDDAGYCTVCANHGDIQWPCATVAALDGDGIPYRCSLHGDGCDQDPEQAHIMQRRAAERGDVS